MDARSVYDDRCQREEQVNPMLWSCNFASECDSSLITESAQCTSFTSVRLPCWRHLIPHNSVARTTPTHVHCCRSLRGCLAFFLQFRVVHSTRRFSSAYLPTSCLYIPLFFPLQRNETVVWTVSDAQCQPRTTERFHVSQAC
jgi:hypothetical protein